MKGLGSAQIPGCADTDLSLAGKKRQRFCSSHLWRGNVHRVFRAIGRRARRVDPVAGKARVVPIGAKAAASGAFPCKKGSFGAKLEFRSETQFAQARRMYRYRPRGGVQMSKQTQDTPGRRNTIKVLVASGAVITGRTLPESWTKPVIDSVVLPAHAQMSPQDEESPDTTTFSASQTVTLESDAGNVDLDFSFDVTGFTPAGDGTLTVVAIGDIDGVAPEFDEEYEITLNGVGLVGFTDNGEFCDGVGSTTGFTIPEADLVTAAGGGTIDLTATSGADTNICSMAQPAQVDEVTITLEFPATT